MEELVDLIATDSPSSQISDKVKEILFAKASERVENARPYVAMSMFGDQENESEE